MTAIAVAIHGDTVAIAELGDAATTYRAGHPAVDARIRERIDSAGAVVAHNAAHVVADLVNAGLADPGVADRAICTRALASLGRPTSKAAGLHPAARAIAALTGRAWPVPPVTGELGVRPDDVAAVAVATSAVFGPAYAAAANRVGEAAVRREMEHARLRLRSMIVSTDTDTPVTDSEPFPVPEPVAIQRSPLTAPPRPVPEKVTILGGIAPEVALYAPVRRVQPPSPSVVRLAGEHGIDLAALTGSGVGGRVIMADVKAAIAAKGT